MKVPTVSILKHCSHNGCRRVAIIAEKVSDFWVTRCSEHRGPITLGKDSMNRLAAITPHKPRRAA